MKEARRSQMVRHPAPARETRNHGSQCARRQLNPCVCGPDAVSFFVKIKLLLLVAGLLFLPCFARASGINWSLPVGAGHTQSSGAPLPDGMVFQLGVFEGGFTPDLTNITQWSANWRALCSAPYLADFDALSASYQVVSNASPFPVGAQLHVYGYRATGGGVAEVFLATDPGWLMPGSDPLAFPTDIDLNTASTVIAGNASSTEGWIQSAAVTASEPPPQFYVQWKWQNFSEAEISNALVSGETADPDGDGISNALEYFYGTSPKIHTTQPITLTGASGGNVLLGIGANPHARAIWSVVESDDLENWSVAVSQPVWVFSSRRYEVEYTTGGDLRFWRVAMTAVSP